MARGSAATKLDGRRPPASSAACSARPRPPPVQIPLERSFADATKAFRPTLSTTPAAVQRSRTHLSSTRAAATSAPRAPTPRSARRSTSLPYSPVSTTTPSPRTPTSWNSSVSDSDIRWTCTTPSPRSPPPLLSQLGSSRTPSPPRSPSVPISRARPGENKFKKAMREKMYSRLQFENNPDGPDLEDLYHI